MTIAIGMMLTGQRFGGAGSETPPDPGPGPGSVATLPLVPDGRWHAGASAATEAGGRLVQAAGLTGPALAAGAAGTGPLVLTDALGRKFWRFNGEAYLDLLANTDGSVLRFSNRNMTVFAVTRGGGGGIFGVGNRTGYGAGSTAVNTGGACLDTSTASNIAPYLRAFSRSSQTAPMVTGTHLSLRGAACRSTAGGGIRLFNGTDAANAAQSSISAAADGAEIGRYPSNPGTSGNWTRMDLYELVVFTRGLTDAEADSVAAALTAHWGIVPIHSQLVLDGDSITAGVLMEWFENGGHVLGEPGSTWLPPGWRVLTVGISGNAMPQLLARRDAAASWATALLPGQNVVAFEIGRNDFSGTTPVTPEQHRANVLQYIAEPVLGLLPRGWTVRAMANIAAGSSLQPAIETWRGLLRQPVFLTDAGAGPGQAYDGKVGIVSTDLIEAGGATAFLTTADATSGGYYAGDATHPNAAGARARATGADTPQYGIAFGLG